MTATARVIVDPFLSFDGTDYSAQVKECTLSMDWDKVEKTASGDGQHTFMPGLINLSCSATLYRTLGAGSLEEALWAARGTSKAIVIRPKQAVKGPENPQYSFSAFATPLDLISGGIGAADEIKLNLVPTSPMTRDATT